MTTPSPSPEAPDPAHAAPHIPTHRAAEPASEVVKPGSDVVEPSSPASRPDSASVPWPRLVAAVIGLGAIVSLMVLAFLAPAINSGPHDLPLAVSGPAPAVAQLEATLDKAQPGAFDVTEHGSLEEVTDAVHDRDAIGGISIATDGSITITSAGGAGTPYKAVLTGIGTSLQASGVTVTSTDIAPLTKDDPNGAGLTALALPLAFGGMISAVLLSRLLQHHPWLRVLGAAAASLAVGFAVVAILQFGFGSVDGDYLETALALALGTAAISLFVLGMESLLGFRGLGIGGVLIMFVANPLSAMATGWQWLPKPWGTIGQLLPPGAAGTLIRSEAFFDGHGSLPPIIVLSVWVAVGVALTGIAVLRRRAKPDAVEGGGAVAVD